VLNEIYEKVMHTVPILSRLASRSCNWMNLVVIIMWQPMYIFCQSQCHSVL